MKKNIMNWKKKFLTQSLFFQPYVEEVDTAEQRLLNYTNDIISEDDDNEGNNLDNPVDRGIESVDVGDDIQVKASSQTTYKVRPPVRISKDQHTQSCGQLQKQRVFSYAALHDIKTTDEPAYWFVTGGACIGQTILFKCLFNGIVDYYNSLPGHNPDEICVLMVAPTGKAAFYLVE